MFNTKMMMALCLSLGIVTSAMAREAQPKDKRHGEGKGHPIVAREAQPKDKRHGEGKGHKIVARERQPGDDRGKHREPGDDRGRKGKVIA